MTVPIPFEPPALSNKTYHLHTATKSKESHHWSIWNELANGPTLSSLLIVLYPVLYQIHIIDAHFDSTGTNNILNINVFKLKWVPILEVNRLQPLASDWHNHQKFDMFQSRQCAPLWCWINSAMYLTDLLYFVRSVYDCKGGHLYMAITQLMALVLFLLRCPCDPIISRQNYFPLVFLFVCWEYLHKGSRFVWTTNCEVDVIETRIPWALRWVKEMAGQNSISSVPSDLISQRNLAIHVPILSNDH